MPFTLAGFSGLKKRQTNTIQEPPLDSVISPAHHRNFRKRLAEFRG
jgi:hypothetical protein